MSDKIIDMQPCLNEKTIDVINARLERMDSKLDALMEYKHKQQGAFKLFVTLGSILGAVFGFVIERFIK